MGELGSGREDSRGRPQRPAEVPGEMGLVVEAGLGGRLGDGEGLLQTIIEQMTESTGKRCVRSRVDW